MGVLLQMAGVIALTVGNLCANRLGVAQRSTSVAQPSTNELCADELQDWLDERR